MDERLLGGFEQALLLVVLHQQDADAGAYAVPIRAELEQRLGRSVSRGSVYTALDRLEARGLVASRMGDPSPHRGGRARRYYDVTPRGVRILRDSRVVMLDLWRGLEAVLGDAS